MSIISETEKELLRELNSHDNCTNSRVSGELAEVSKLLFRLNIVGEAFDSNVELFSSKHSPNVLAALNYLFHDAIKKCEFPGLKDFTPTVAVVKKPSDFDYQCSDALKISKMSSDSGSMSSLDVAKKIAACLIKNNIVLKTEISGPGFINIQLNPDYLSSFCDHLILNGVLPPGVKFKNVVVDFSSPNIAKEMHAGHLRSTIIGETLCRILEYVNFKVLRLNHVGDWGTQFGMLIAHLEDTYPAFANEAPQISDLQTFYKSSKKRFDTDEEFKKRAHSRVVSLQSGDPCVKKGWETLCEASRQEFSKIYKRLGVTLIERGESFYQDRMVSVVKELESKGKLTTEDNCKVFHIPGFKVPLMVVKSDGGFTYDTSDIATVKQRLLEEKADWVVYVVDSGQSDHLESIFKVAYLVGWGDPSVHLIKHVGFGVVLGEDGKKFKTRSGSVIKLSELLDESVSRSKTRIVEKNTDGRLTDKEVDAIAEAVGYSCVKYADLSHNLVLDYEFSFDRMLDDRGNTAVYLMYIYTRLRSIIRSSKMSDEEIVSYARDNPIKIENIHELKVLRKLIHFPEIVHRVVYEHHPHVLCEYMYEMSVAATEYYNNCHVVNRDKETGAAQSVNLNRICQVYAIALVLKQGFDLIGITALEKM